MFLIEEKRVIAGDDEVLDVRKSNREIRKLIC